MINLEKLDFLIKGGQKFIWPKSLCLSATARIMQLRDAAFKFSKTYFCLGFSNFMYALCFGMELSALLISIGIWYMNGLMDPFYEAPSCSFCKISIFFASFFRTTQYWLWFWSLDI